MILRDDEVTGWIFDIDDQLSRQISQRILLMVQMLGLSAVLISGWLMTEWWVFSLALPISLVFWLYYHYFKNQPSKSVRLTHLGVCHHYHGQMPLLLQAMWRYPWCIVVEFSELTSASRKHSWYLILWRHHFTQTAWRQLALVLVWLSGQESGYE